MYVVISIGANATMNCVSNIKTELKNLGLPRPDLLIKLEDHNLKTNKFMTRKFYRSSYSLSDWLCGCNVQNAFFYFGAIRFTLRHPF